MQNKQESRSFFHPSELSQHPDFIHYPDYSSQTQNKLSGFLYNIKRHTSCWIRGADWLISLATISR